MAKQQETTHAALVINEAVHLGDILSVDLMDDTWGSLSCTEAEAFASLFYATGHTALADSIIEQHGWHDEEGDEHYSPANEELHKSLHGLR